MFVGPQLVPRTANCKSILQNSNFQNKQRRCRNYKLSCMQVKAERPAWYLSVICGALLRVIEQVNLRSADYLGFLEKGQLPPARLTLTSFEQQLVLEGLQSVLAT